MGDVDQTYQQATVTNVVMDQYMDKADWWFQVGPKPLTQQYLARLEWPGGYARWVQLFSLRGPEVGRGSYDLRVVTLAEEAKKAAEEAREKRIAHLNARLDEMH